MHFHQFGFVGYTPHMSNPEPTPPPPPPPFDAFKELAAKLVQVPKKEADEREAAYQREQADKPKRGPKSN